MENQLNLFKESLAEWKEEVQISKTREADFTTLSGEKQKVCYFPDEPDNNYMKKLYKIPKNAL